MRKRGMILFFTLMLLFCGCGSDSEQNNPFTAETNNGSETNDDHILTLSMRSPETLNPILNKEETVDLVLKLVFQPLIAIDENEKPVAAVAEGWSISDDGMTATIQLRSDILWQNGTKLTADDVAFSIDMINAAEEGTVYKNAGNYISSYRMTGEYTIDIVFAENFSKNMGALCFPVISREYYQGQSDLKSAANMTPMGSGVYETGSYKAGSELILNASPTYVEGEAQIETVRVIISGGADADAYAFEQGLTDVLVTEAIESGRYANGESSEYTFISGEYSFIGFNFNHALFQDKLVRQAVNYALPKEAIHDNVYLKYAEMTNNPVSPKSWLYEENVMLYDYDTEMAATFLKNAGWTDNNGDGKLEKSGENGDESLQVSILVNSENTARLQIARRLAEELNILGFDARIDVRPFEEYQARFQNGSFDMVIGGWQMSPVTDLYELFGSEGSLNYIGYSDETTDRLLEEANSAVGEGRIVLAYSALQKRLAEEIPYISIAFQNNILFTSEEVGGVITPMADNVFYSINRWSYNRDEE